MESDLAELYERFDRYWTRLEVDLRKATRRLPESVRPLFRAPRPTFAEFQALWKGIERNPVLLERWTRRLSPNGYDEETQAIEAELARFREAYSQAPDQDADSREAA